MSGRTDIWMAGLQTFPQRPLLGTGVGTYGKAVAEYKGGTPAAHNLALRLLVEQGFIGFTLFAGLFGACVWTIFRSPPPHRALWGVLILTWLIGGMSGDQSAWKITWVFFGLVSAQGGLNRTAREVLTRGPKGVYPACESLSAVRS